MESDSNEEAWRLQRFLARAGCGSRRGCEAFILDGRVRINGRISQ
ncbi:MAG: S4 domain-containing protein, partial [Verrucomicrobiota bacterium]|nr:S4 domain-containing protein [Verrucomicrobiota bacterium]